MKFIGNQATTFTAQVQDFDATWCGTAGGTADALTLTPTPPITAYKAGRLFSFKSGSSANTGAATVQVSGIATPRAIQWQGSALVAGNIAANTWYLLVDDGTQFQLINPVMKSINGMSVTASTGTLTLTNGKTLSVSNTMTLAGTDGNTYTLPPITSTLGYRNLPPVGTKTGSYTLAAADIGKYVQVGSGGSITIPDATFAEGDAISVCNNTSGDITITCSITTAYIAGTDSDKATMTLATRGVATILFLSSTVCTVAGNVT